MLAVGDLESVAVAVLGPVLRYAIASAGRPGITRAKVWIDDIEVAGRADDPSPPRALIKAWLGCVLALLDRAPSIGGQPGDSSHRSA